MALYTSQCFGVLMRLSFGEFDWPTEGVRRMYLRRALLDAIAEHAQDELLRVYDDMLPSYRAGRLEEKMKDWERRYPPWLIRSLFNLLNRYGRPPLERPKKLDFAESEGSLAATHFIITRIIDNLTSMYGVELHLPEPPDGLRPYYPLLETQDEYRDEQWTRAADSLEGDLLLRHAGRGEKNALADSIRDSNTLMDYCQIVEDVYTTEGFVRRSSSEKKSLKTHLEWTARRWFKGETLPTIIKERQKRGEQRGLTEPAVSLAVKKILTIVNDDRPILS